MKRTKRYMSLTQELLNVGLSNKEADVYLAALQLGYSSVQEIAERAGINRTTAYTHIKNLIGRGLLNAVKKNSRVFYVAEKPDRLKHIYKQQEDDARRRRELLDKIMPELESIYNVAKDRPSVRYFDYRNDTDLHYIREELYQTRAKEVYNIFNFKLFSKYINKNHLQRVLDRVNKFKVIYIAHNRVIDRKIHPLLDNEKLEIRYLSEAKFDLLSEILINGENVHIGGNGDLLIIKDKLFSQTLSLLFHALWGMAEDF